MSNWLPAITMLPLVPRVAPFVVIAALGGLAGALSMGAPTAEWRAGSRANAVAALFVASVPWTVLAARVAWLGAPARLGSVFLVGSGLGVLWRAWRLRSRPPRRTTLVLAALAVGWWCWTNVVEDVPILAWPSGHLVAGAPVIAEARLRAGDRLAAHALFDAWAAEEAWMPECAAGWREAEILAELGDCEAAANAAPMMIFAWSDVACSEPRSIPGCGVLDPRWRGADPTGTDGVVPLGPQPERDASPWP